LRYKPGQSVIPQFDLIAPLLQHAAQEALDRLFDGMFTLKSL
jgi:hypothetical protein